MSSAVKTAGLLAVVLPVVGVFAVSTPAAAQVGCCPTPDLLLREKFRGPGLAGDSLQQWYTKTFWPIVNAGIVEATNQIVAAIATQSASIGGFIDAQNNVANLSSLQKREAQSIHTYLPSEALCRYGSLSESLAQSSAVAVSQQVDISSRALNRQLLKTGGASGQDVKSENGKAGISPGQSPDKAARWEQYTKLFCNPSDANGALKGICSGSKDTQYNKDIDFTSSLAAPLTIAIGGDAATPDKQNISALADNLYAHDLFYNIPPADLMDPSIDTPESQALRSSFLSMRSLIAKRSVAENSFAALTGMKAASSGGTKDYMQRVVQELGAKPAEAEALIGNNPSYYAQMEVLSKKLYQSPSFFVNLMDKPANVKRQQTALKSVDLMQGRDIYESMARTEMLLAVLLEIYVDRQRTDTNMKALQSQ